MPTPLRDQFLQAMSRAAQTVNVVTTDGPAGRAGVTVSAMASVSADTPRPTLLVCVHHQASAAGSILGNGHFVVNILRDDQAYIADAFAGRFKDQLADKFDVTDWVAMGSGSPRVAEGLVALDCRVTSSDRIGTHHVFMGAVQEVHLAPSGLPLIYAHRAYGSPRRIDTPASLADARQGQEARLSVAALRSFGPYVLPGLVRRLAEAGPLDLTLVEGDQRRVEAALRSGEAELGLLHEAELGPGYVTLPLAELDPVVVLAADHPLARRGALEVRDLAGQPLVLLAAPPADAQVLHLLRAGGVEPKIAFRSSSFEMVRGLVGQGLGVAVLSMRPATTMSCEGRPLATLPLRSAERPGRIVLAHRADARLGPAAERFLALARSPEPILA
ncbi:flavin reductase [Rhodobacter sp. Har01]|uniref:LysR substrate-binding domain-containing protein n=1 Tax=Rhodobacter sp. Har01 TaxID=2883999 RepID=UPI001D073394|nr:LysR substrate-binding domain-containing protein [Rhodobacter sp. Har01]MCB6179633.1 flavin reductase [Rhodobacter sp. Har01]